MRRAPVKFSEFVGVRVESGTTQRIEKAAEGQGTYPADWLRHMIQKQLEAEESRGV